MKLFEFSKHTLTKVFDHQKDQDLYAKVIFRQSSFKDVEKETFKREYLAIQLALISKIWPLCCEENSIQIEEGDKVFLKATLACFESPSMKELAIAYSEYLYTKEEANSGEIVLNLVEKFFDRLKMPTKIKRGSKVIISPAFQILLEHLDGYRMSFENEFLENVFEGFE